ncbi:MAG TPA: hypothetical protein VIH74_07420 [Candidatus Acidoferrum sp.]
MAVHYNIQESSDALEILVRNKISVFLRVTCGGFAGWLVWFIIGTHLPSILRSGLAVVAGVSVFALFRQMTARLTVTALEFQVGGAQRRDGKKLCAAVCCCRRQKSTAWNFRNMSLAARGYTP